MNGIPYGFVKQLSLRARENQSYAFAVFDHSAHPWAYQMRAAVRWIKPYTAAPWTAKAIFLFPPMYFRRVPGTRLGGGARIKIKRSESGEHV